jgi:hypothetical protein
MAVCIALFTGNAISSNILKFRARNLSKKYIRKFLPHRKHGSSLLQTQILNKQPRTEGSVKLALTGRILMKYYI